MSVNKNKSVVEETLLQIKAVEDAINENAKGILASTMKQEISELVKESLGGSRKTKSLREQEEAPADAEGEGMEDEVDDFEETETEVNTEVEPAAPMGGEMETEVGMEVDNEELPPVDMTQSPMADVMKVFKAMGDEDGIIVKKDNEGNIHLSDTTKGSDYFIQMDGMSNDEMPMKAEAMESVLYELQYEDEMDDFSDEDEMDDFSDFEELDYEDDFMEESFKPKGRIGKMKFKYPSKLKRGVTEMSKDEFEEQEEDEEDEVVYEIEVDDESEMKESFKSKGMTGKGPGKFKYPSKLKKGVTEMGDMENEGEWMEINDEFSEMEGEFNEMDFVDPDIEMKEASRTLGNGKYWGRNGLPKPKSAPRHIRVESKTAELNLLKEKNEEYKKALDFFRNKLNEVAVFNSNLAYSTRLFTEHTTTKQEKINILRRFDNVESLKESKTLYKTIKSELDGVSNNKGVFTESIQQKVIKTPQNGSATNLIENKTYENPQFLRMKDLMAKIK
jgi:hypothetical protein